MTSTREEGLGAFRLARLDVALLVLVYAAALYARLQFWQSNPYTAEAAHYRLAGELWAISTNIEWAYGGVRPDYEYLFWQRPLFSVLLFPGAAVSFEAYRLLHVALTAAIPVLGAFLLHAMGIRRLFWAAAAAVVAIVPYFAVWGTLVMPDSVMLLLVVAALVADQLERPFAAAGLLLAAVWVKEVAMVALLVLLAFSFAPLLRQRPFWPMPLDRRRAAYLAAALLAFVPLIYSLSMGGRFPGWREGGDPLWVLDRATLVPWLLPLLVIGLLWPRTRRLSAVAGGFVGFLLIYALAFDKAAEGWYFVAPAVLSIFAVFANLDRLARGLARWRSPAGHAGLVVVILLLLVQAFGTSSAARDVVTSPLTRTVSWGWPEWRQWESIREEPLREILAHPAAAQRGTWGTVDVDWSFAMYPVDERAERVITLDSGGVSFFHQGIDRWAEVIEQADLTLLRTNDHWANQAVRDVYADCLVGSNAEYHLYQAQNCAGRLPALEDRYDELAAQ